MGSKKSTSSATVFKLKKKVDIVYIYPIPLIKHNIDNKLKYIVKIQSNIFLNLILNYLINI